MTKRIFRAIILVALVVLVAALGLITGVLYPRFEQQAFGQLREDTSYLEAGYQTGGTEFLMQMASASDATRITLVADDGAVLYDNRADAQTLENHGDRTEVQAALACGVGQVIRYSSTLSEKTCYYARRLSDGRVLRVSRSHSSLISLLRGMLLPMLAILAAAIALSAILAGKLSRSIVRPINTLDLECPAASCPYPELAPLMQRLDVQSGQINAQIVELRRKQQEFASITESMQEGFLILDSSANLLSYNSSALHLLDAEAPTSGLNLLAISDSAALRHAVEQALAGQHCEEQMLHGGRHYRLIANPVCQEDEVIGAVLILLDETEKEQREQLRREFTANVSHELKTPLTSISGFAEIIKSGMVRTEDISRFAANIYEEAQRLITLVGDIIKLSQMDENSVPVEKQPVDLYALAESVAERLTPNADQVAVNLVVRGEPLCVMGVPQILDEMATNLCDNAIKYNRPGGSVTLTVKRVAAGVLFSVADTGIGIPQADRDRVFERFYRVDKSHSKKIGGTGLGLSIVKHGAAYHGAQLSLESEPERGTAVTLLFPQEPEQTI